MNNSDAMKRLAYFCFNFNPNWLNECWKNDTAMQQHLQHRWVNYCHNFDSTAYAFLRFYLELDAGNQEQLNNYILKSKS